MGEGLWRVVAEEVEIELGFWLLDLLDDLHAQALSVEFDCDSC